MKKLCFVVAVVILLTSTLCFNSYASVDESDFPCGGVIELVEVELSRVPLWSRFSFGDSKPDLSGTVLEITYYDGEVERITVKKNEAGYSAGDFSVSILNYRNVETELFLGINIVETSVVVSFKPSSYIEYYGTGDYKYLNFPSLF